MEKRGWLMTALLFSFMLINFADKAVLGLSADPIIKELGLTHTQFGQLGSSFFLLFSLSAILVGFVINRASTKWTLAIMGLVWALAQAPMMLTTGLPLLVLNRVLLGAGEGPAFPVAVHAIFKWFPNERRPLPTSIISMGGAVGAGLVAPAITYVILRYSWHVAFGLLGLIGFVWVVAWIALGREGPLTTASEADPGGADERQSYWRLLTCRTFVGGAVLSFAAYWLLTLAVVWLPSYLHNGAGYAPSAVGWIVTLPSLLQIVAIPMLSGFSERLKQRGVSSRLSRGVLASLCVGLAGAMAVALPFATGHVLPIVCTAIAFSFGTATFTMAPILAAEITPARQRGAILGISTAISTSAGIFAPVVMGMVVDMAANPTQGFRNGFMLVGGCVVVVAILSLLLINPEADLKRFAADRKSKEPGAVTPARQLLAEG
jgi:MFS family permease